MKKLLDEQKKGIQELMLKRAISRKYLNKLIAEVIDEVKNFDPEVGDKESQEYQDLKRANQKYNDTLYQLKAIDDANQGDIFAYSVIDECAEEVKELLK